MSELGSGRPDPAAVADRVVAKLAAEGFEREQADIAGLQATVARTSAFKLRRLATRLHVFVPVATVASALAAPLAHAFSAASVAWAKARKPGLPIGLQTGVATVPVLVSPVVEEDARIWAERPQPKDFGAFSRPVLIDTTRMQLHTYEGRMVWGAVYSGYLNGLVRTIGAALR